MKFLLIDWVQLSNCVKKLDPVRLTGGYLLIFLVALQPVFFDQ